MMVYIDEELWNWIEKRCAEANIGFTNETVDHIIEDCGIWRTFDEMILILDDQSLTFELLFREYWYIVNGDTILFTDPDEFSEDLDEYLDLANEWLC